MYYFQQMTKPKLHEDWIDPHAKKIVQTLQAAGFEAYLVGGCVRDLLAGIHPKDYDIATSAHPEDIRKKISGSHIIGRRFRLVLVRRATQQYEVATFRRSMNATDLAPDEDGAITGDNYFGTSKEDAQRRDFTINALFYDPGKHQLIDFVDGLADIEKCTIRMIGEPLARFVEDPIRILRAVRLSHKLNFMLEPSLRQAALDSAPELQKSILPRRREEWIKIMRLDEPFRAFMELFDLGALKETLPSLHDLFLDSEALGNFRLILSRIPNSGFNYAETGDVFSALMFAVAFAKSGGNIQSHSADFESNYLSFMKDELGMFKTEIAQFTHSIELMESTQNYEGFLKRGRRRQEGFLKNESLPTALKFGLLDQSLNSVALHFWIHQFNQSKHQQPSE